MRSRLFVVLMGMVLLAACSKPGNSTATAPGTGEKIKDDVQALGHDLKNAATQAASDAKPAIKEAKDKGQALIHDGAQKVADWTATQPATTQQPR